MELWELFYTFFMIGFVSFGGGYAIIPVIEHEVTTHGWMTTQEFSEVIAVAGMAPGPIATNSSIFVGYQVGGLLGASVALTGMVLPSLLLITLIATLISRFHHHKMMKSAFYGLRPIITAFIIYAAIRFGQANLYTGTVNWHFISLVLIFGLSLFALLRLRIHPILVILCSGLMGMVFYG